MRTWKNTDYTDTLSATQVKRLILNDKSDMLPPDVLPKADNNGVTEDMQYIILT